jgi:endonuclease-3 related protein
MKEATEAMGSAKGCTRAPVDSRPEAKKGAGNSFADILADIYRRLHDAYGPQKWWPADSALEVIVGAILTQNTTWQAVEKAIARIKDRALLSIPALHQTSIDVLSHLVRPAGYFRLKARRVKNLVDLLVREYSGDLERMGKLPTGQLRDKLLAVNGIGPETADSILLYAFRRPVFVVDAYTLRVMSRHRLVLPKAAYGELQGFFMRHLPPDEATFNEYHALLVQVGKRHCRRTPSCPGCPLEPLLY